MNKTTIVVGLLLVGMLLACQLNQVESCRQKNADSARSKIQQLLAEYPELSNELRGSQTTSSTTSTTTTIASTA